MGFFKWLSDLFGFSSGNEVVKAQAPKAEAPVVSAPKLTKASLGKLTKVQLEEKGRELGVELDRRKKKDVLVAEVLKASKK
tara:strand:- start:74 stop:316 length:243 start_codon:yes stop_codon:yes gene_type:complete